MFLAFALFAKNISKQFNNSAIKGRLAPSPNGIEVMKTSQIKHYRLDLKAKCRISLLIYIAIRCKARITKVKFRGTGFGWLPA
jgi:hypothetical protein